MQTLKAVNVSSVNENLLGGAVTESPFIQPQIKHKRLEFPAPSSSALFSSEQFLHTEYTITVVKSLISLMLSDCYVCRVNLALLDFLESL